MPKDCAHLAPAKNCLHSDPLARNWTHSDFLQSLAHSPQTGKTEIWAELYQKRALIQLVFLKNWLTQYPPWKKRPKWRLNLTQIARLYQLVRTEAVIFRLKFGSGCLQVPGNITKIIIGNGKVK